MTVFSVRLMRCRYAKGKFALQLQDCISRIEGAEKQIEQSSRSIEELRVGIQELDRELSESGATAANFRENIRLRKIKADLKENQNSMDKLDLDAAGQARQDYERTYKDSKEQEVQAQSKVGSLTLISFRAKAYVAEKACSFGRRNQIAKGAPSGGE